jgi:hypothetical protein
MATELIASTTSAANSADITVTAGSQVTVSLNGKDSAIDNNVVQVQLKSSAGEWMQVGSLFSSQPAQSIVSPGTYRVRKLASALAFGVDRS